MPRVKAIFVGLVTCALAAAVCGQTTAPVTAPNPLYDAWQGQEKKTVTFDRQETISGGAPVGGQRPARHSTVSETCTQLTDAEAVIQIAQDNQPAQTLTIPAKVSPDDPAFPKAAGTEDIKIGDKTYTCKKYTYYTRSKAEMGRDGQGLAGTVTVWIADGVPGGIVQRNISLTIRASYDITEKMVAR